MRAPTILRYLLEAASSEPSRDLFRETRGSFSYEEFVTRVVAASHALGDELRPRDRVILYCDQTIPLAMMMMACAVKGLLPIPVSPIFSESYLLDLQRSSGSTAIFTTANHHGHIEDLGIKTFVYGLDRGYYPQPAPVSASEARSAIPLFDTATNLGHALEVIAEAAETRDSSDSYIVQPTSGSTGRPKLVVRSYAAFARYAEFVGNEVRKLGIGSSDSFLAINALTHAFAGHMLTTTIRLGATACVPSDLDVATPLDDVRALNPTVLPMTPRVLRSMVRQHESRTPASDTKLFGDRARLVLSAGGKADVSAFRRLREEGVEVCEFYGSSEGSIIALTPVGGWKPEKAGKVVADAEVDIASDGEIHVRSPGVFLSYLGDEEMTSLVKSEAGFFKTGDLGVIDDDGYLRILGRKRDVFNTPEGSNIYPERIEIMLESLPWVRQAFLVGDSRPFLTAHIVVCPKSVPPEGHNHLTPESDPDLYEMAGKELERLSDSLEHIERVVAFSLYRREFPETSYAVLAAGKVRRDRNRFIGDFSEDVERLYGGLTRGSAHYVPPGERRFAERTRRPPKKAAAANRAK